MPYPPPVRIKTFSTHIVVNKCQVVRKMARFTHGMSNIELDVCEKRFNTHAYPGITFERQAQAVTEDGDGIGSRKGRGPTQWGGPAESSVPVRARQSAMPETDGRAGVRGKARFTHVMTFFRRDVRRKRFSTHGNLHSMEITT